MPDSLDAINAEQNARIDSLVGKFTGEMQSMVNRAQVRVQAWLQSKLTLDDAGKIARTPANQRILRSIDARLEQEMKALGFDELRQSFVSQFPGEFKFFDRAIEAMGLDPVKFSKSYQDFFAAQQMSADDNVAGAVTAAAQGAKRQALFQVGGLSPTALGEILAAQFGRSVPQAQSLADTAITVFYRSIAAKGYDEIQRTQSAKLRYSYYGPDDKLTRRFCQVLIESGRTYTRAQIDAMSNGQLPNVFITAGGYNCRHQWALSAEAPSTKGKDLRSATTVRREIEATARAYDALIEAQKSAVRDLSASSAPADQAAAKHAARALRRFTQAKDEGIRSVLYAEKEAQPDIVFDAELHPSTRRAWLSKLRQFSRLAGSGAPVDGETVLVTRSDTDRSAFKAAAWQGKGVVELAPEGDVRDAVHEMAHWMESLSPDVHDACVEFLERRTKGEAPVSMRAATGDKRYGPGERTRRDKFTDPYIGKIYPSAADGKPSGTEVLSMGMEMMQENPLQLLEDPDFFDFLWGVLRRK
jgi:hypothetical protein